MHISKNPLYNSDEAVADGSGWAARRLFEANNPAIGKKNNAADRPSPADHRPQGVVQRVPNNPTAPTPRCINLLGALALATMDKLRDESANTLTTRAALLALSKYPGCSIDALRANLGLSHPATVRVVAGLMQAGLLTKTAGTDRRSVALNLSIEGHAAVAQALQKRQQALSHMLLPLSARELRQFETLALKILWNETRDGAHALKICRLCDEADCLAQGCPVECKACGQALPS